MPQLRMDANPKIDSPHDDEQKDRDHVHVEKNIVVPQRVKDRTTDAADEQERQAEARERVIAILAAHAPEPVEHETNKQRGGYRVTRLADHAGEISLDVE